MNITKIEVFRLPTSNVKVNSPIGCRIHTDAGITGDGEAGMAYGVGESAAYGMVCDLAELVVGMDPLQTENVSSLAGNMRIISNETYCSWLNRTSEIAVVFLR